MQTSSKLQDSDKFLNLKSLQDQLHSKSGGFDIIGPNQQINTNETAGLDTERARTNQALEKMESMLRDRKTQIAEEY